MRRLLTSLLLIAAVSVAAIAAKRPPASSRQLSGYDLEAKIAQMDSLALDPIEGVWEMPADRVKLVIERCDDEPWDYRAVLLDSENRQLRPGTVMGYLQATARTDKFTLWLYSEWGQGMLAAPVSCNATLSADFSSITYVKPSIKWRLRVNFARWLPNFFRGISISAEPRSEAPIEGFRRIAPLQSYAPAGKIIYL